MHKLTFFCVIALILCGRLNAQTPYYPPTTGTNWDVVSPASLGWCQVKLDTLIQYAGDKNTKALIILKGGKIALEQYYGTFTKDSLHVWNSAGKSFTSFLVGIAQEEGLLNIQDKVSQYLGNGWTSAPQAKEDVITIWHQLTMTTGLDEGVADSDCTVDSCLQYKADAGTRWTYHNAPYTLLGDVVEVASGQTYNAFTNTRVKNKIGMNGLWFPFGYNTVYISNARSMARYGLLVLRNGIWNNDTLLHDTQYLSAMHNSSQSLNPSYGYLWWLNGKGTYMQPGVQFVFNGDIVPNAPDDMYAGLGKNDQKLYIIPSMDMVVVRMGDKAINTALALSGFDDELWKRIMDLECLPSALTEETAASLLIYPNPAQDLLYIRNETQTPLNWQVQDVYGQSLLRGTASEVGISTLLPGLYFLSLQDDRGKTTKITTFVKQ